jgi:uncharacterized membrane protein YfcA
MEVLAQLQMVFVLSGLAVGLIVGLTGVGGGSLMTPILLHFGIAPTSAVGTDLLYAAITKSGGIFVHNKKRHIDWRITGQLTLGSVPAALLTLQVLHRGNFDVEVLNHLIKTLLGFALIFTALAIVFKHKLLAYSRRHGLWITRLSQRNQGVATVISGIVLGVLVTITSIGAGAIGTVALFLLYPLLPTVKLVGTEITHAVPLTLIAGLGHASVGNMDWPLLLNLLMGSLPGIYIGSHLSHSVADHYLRPALATILLLVGGKMVL